MFTNSLRQIYTTEFYVVICIYLNMYETIFLIQKNNKILDSFYIKYCVTDLEDFGAAAAGSGPSQENTQSKVNKSLIGLESSLP